MFSPGSIYIPILVGLICAILGYLMGRISLLKYKNEITALQAELSSSNELNDNLQSQISDREEKLKVQIANNANLKSELESNKTDNDKLRSHIAHLDEQLKEQKDFYVILQSDMDSSKADNEKLRGKNSELEEELKSQKNAFASLQSHVDTHKVEGEKLRGRNSELEEELMSQKNSVAGLLSDVDTHKVEGEKLRGRNSELEEELMSQKNSVTELHEELSNCRNKNHALMNRISELEELRAVKFDADAARNVMGNRVKENDLKIVEGIGPKIEELFHKNEVKTWKDLANLSPGQCNEILETGGPRYTLHSPDTWPEQARHAHDGRWQELKAWQDNMSGGRE